MAIYITSDHTEHDNKENSEAHELGLKLVRIVKDSLGRGLTRDETVACFTLAYNHDDVRQAIRVCKGER